MVAEAEVNEQYFDDSLSISGQFGSRFVDMQVPTGLIRQLMARLPEGISRGFHSGVSAETVTNRL